MNQEQWTAVDAYLGKALLPPDPTLEATRLANSSAGLPAIDVSPSQGKLLYLLAMMLEARRILEIGTLGGYSTIWMAKALPVDGMLVTLEADPKHALVAQQNVERAGFGHLVRILTGAALESLPKVAAQYKGAFDLIFIDADKANAPEYFRWALSLSRRGTVILVDNVVRKGEIAKAEGTDPGVQGMRRLTEMLAAEPRVAATAIQTVGVKGYDGFVIARVCS
jgi:predicted O-methyltransferase YrrM